MNLSGKKLSFLAFFITGGFVANNINRFADR
jgi:hypothetical protein